ncbi:hypothetical protein [Devosia sp. Leaf64]|uniref:hypothetical protein n=1 Tax=Devosia sp. Leaf64 TaxID=1736229 RepID=UPI0007123E9F|nr:hypothetical protein [Devosia sp. Leaf64]KQN72189.1 hypothetical protein ASE94_06575 [Devosia sp. Leaf64]
MIQTKPGPSGEFHYVLLLNPNAAMEWMRGQKKVQDAIYSRVIDRLMEVGAYGEIEAVHDYWKAQAEANAIAAAVAAAATEPVAPKQIPAPPANPDMELKMTRRRALGPVCLHAHLGPET